MKSFKIVFFLSLVGAAAAWEDGKLSSRKPQCLPLSSFASLSLDCAQGIGTLFAAPACAARWVLAHVPLESNFQLVGSVSWREISARCSPQTQVNVTRLFQANELKETDGIVRMLEGWKEGSRKHVRENTRVRRQVDNTSTTPATHPMTSSTHENHTASGATTSAPTTTTDMSTSTGNTTSTTTTTTTIHQTLTTRCRCRGPSFPRGWRTSLSWRSCKCIGCSTLRRQTSAPERWTWTRAVWSMWVEFLPPCNTQCSLPSTSTNTTSSCSSTITCRPWGWSTCSCRSSPWSLLPWRSTSAR
eukprot:m.124564 g.124564  ORF g.124564 m.124564 type:complete len:301 (+) comp14652_c1_seq1:114-1016(+)